MKWWETLLNWLGRDRQHKSVQEQAAYYEFHDLQKEAKLAEIEEDTATLVAKVIRASSHGAEMEARHQEGLARDAAARRERINTEADVLRRTYQIRE